jgi:hypothetical protein
MSDFLDRYGDELRTTLLARGRQSRRRLRIVRRGWIAALAVLVVATPAVAVTRLWQPLLGRDDGAGTVTATQAPVAKSATEALGLLRRAQTDTDRANAAPLLRILGPHQNEVQTADVRSPAAGWALIPLNAVDEGPNGTATNQICLADTTGMVCTPANMIATHGLLSSDVGASSTTLAGLTPDGVSQVRFTPDNGDPVQTNVTDNFFELHIASTTPQGTVVVPPDVAAKTGHTTAPAPPAPAPGTLEWLDANGQVIFHHPI